MAGSAVLIQDRAGSYITATPSEPVKFGISAGDYRQNHACGPRLLPVGVAIKPRGTSQIRVYHLFEFDH